MPGYGFAKRTFEDKQKWSALTDGYFTSNRNIDRLALVIQLIDSRIGPTKDDEMMLDFMNQSDIPYIIIATKADKLNVTNRKAALEALNDHPCVRERCQIIPFSALDGMGKDEAMRQILALLEI